MTESLTGIIVSIVFPAKNNPASGPARRRSWGISPGALGLSPENVTGAETTSPIKRILKTDD
ncbi:hypothetical protein ABFB09_05925 [Dehalogenimonas sp. THU2]|uniref:hypothetical protein n=1 Tax=Dehalogenimonas sp. THU2 TaxID=3151121 RepID=UPI003218B7F1